MFLYSHLHVSHGLADVTVTARTVSFKDHMCLMSVFVFQIEKAFDLFSLPKDDENVLKPMNLFNLKMKVLLSCIAA